MKKSPWLESVPVASKVDHRSQRTRSILLTRPWMGCSIRQVALGGDRILRFLIRQGLDKTLPGRPATRSFNLHEDALQKARRYAASGNARTFLACRWQRRSLRFVAAGCCVASEGPGRLAAKSWCFGLRSDILPDMGHRRVQDQLHNHPASSRYASHAESPNACRNPARPLNKGIPSPSPSSVPW